MAIRHGCHDQLEKEVSFGPNIQDVEKDKKNDVLLGGLEMFGTCLIFPSIGNNNPN